MQFGVLGPLAVTTDDGEPVTVPGTLVRALLADLLVHRNQVVSADRLVLDLWGDEAPANPGGALQVRVSQLRKALQDAEAGARELVESRAPGYLLRTTATDADRFAALAAAGGEADLEAGLALWRGQPYADVADAEWVRAEATRLAEQRLVVRERLAAARLARGQHDQEAADLGELVARHPLREGLRALHLRALYAAGRQSEALAGYGELRERLADELGLDPGPELVALHRRILAQDPTLIPPPAPVTVVRNRLPARVDELVGRGELLAQLHRTLTEHRMVTLLGPGGAGKTRLALEVAGELAERRAHPDGVVLVELAALPPGPDPDPVAELVLTALGITESGGPADGEGPTGRLVTALARRRLLLVLDNTEHVVDPVADLVARLLPVAPQVVVLTTGREPLALGEEVLLDVGPLALPRGDDPDAVARSAAARLFAVRATRRHSGFRVEATNAAAVAELCRRLDGLPLAIELAATRVRSLGVTGLLDQLDDRFAVLTTTQRDMPVRRRSLDAVIRWSWDLLGDDERNALAGMSVFAADGADPDAARSVAQADLDVLGRLVDRSMLVAEPTPSGATRFRLLESVAAFARDRLAESGRAAITTARHRDWCLALAQDADAALRGPGQTAALRRLDVESANLRLALADGPADRLVAAMCWYWFLRGRIGDAVRALARTTEPALAPWRIGFALQHGAQPTPEEITAALAGHPTPLATWFVAEALIGRSDVDRAGPLLERAVAAAWATDDEWTEAAALTSRAMLHHAVGDLTALAADSARSAALFARIGDPWGRLQASDWVGGHAELVGSWADATHAHRAGLAVAQELGLTVQVGAKLTWLAWLALQTGETEQAHALAQQALHTLRDQDRPDAAHFALIVRACAARRAGWTAQADTELAALVDRGRSGPTPALFLSMVLMEHGRLAEQLGDPAVAMARHNEAFRMAETFGARRDLVAILEAAASVATDPVAAAAALGTAAAARRELGVLAAPVEQADRDEVVARLHGQLGADRVAALLAEPGSTPQRAMALLREGHRSAAPAAQDGGAQGSAAQGGAAQEAAATGR